MCRPFTKQLLTLRVGRDVPKKTAAKAIIDEYITKTLQLNGVSMPVKFVEQGASHSTYTNIMKFVGQSFPLPAPRTLLTRVASDPRNLINLYVSLLALCQQTSATYQ